MPYRSMRSPLAAGLLLSLGWLGMAASGQSGYAAEPMGPPPGVAVVHNWTGCYAGVNAGWMVGADRMTTHPGQALSLGVSPLTPSDAALLTNTYTSEDSAGFTGGAQIGCNWQSVRSPFVFGIEADFNGSQLSESTFAGHPPVMLPVDGTNIPGRSEVVTKSLDWFSTIRGRVGLSWDRWLGYLTAGLAVAHIDSSFELSAGPFAGSDSRTRYGWAGGGGLEYAFSKNWSARIEYLYLDFGTYTYQVRHLTTDTRFWAVDVDAQEHVVRAGLNYKF